MSEWLKWLLTGLGLKKKKKKSNDYLPKTDSLY